MEILHTLLTVTAFPEIFLTSMALIVLVLGLFLNKQIVDRICYWISILSLLLTATIIINNFSITPKVLALYNLYISDPMANLLKITACLISLLIFIYSFKYNEDRKIFKNEYYVLGIFSVIGLMITVSANHLLTIYLGLELMSFCLYVMTAFYRDDKLAVESAMKYFVLGALASSILLYGMSLLYGLTGSLEIKEIHYSVRQQFVLVDPALALAVVFIIVGLAFKLGVVPFHMWVPDVYQGAPTSTTALISTLPKIAAFAIIMRLIVVGLESVQDIWNQMLMIISVLSVAIGNLVAIVQDNFKRMLAYSSIAHMGFVLFGILSGTLEGYSASLFYVIVYAVMSTGAFGIIMYIANKNNECDQINDLKGLNERNPQIAFLILILMISMTGLPPTAGFFIKLSVIQSLIDAELIWVAVSAVILTVIGAFYYLRVIKFSYFDSPEKNSIITITTPYHMKVVLIINVCAIILITPWIDPLISICKQVMLHLH